LALSETYQRSSRLPEGVTELPPADRYLVALEKRLSAEQLLASVLLATENHQRLAATHPDYADLEKRFLAAFANEAREPELEVNATVKASLFLMNDGKVQELLQPREGNLLDRLSKMDDPRQQIEELYLSLFSRLPKGDELAEVLGFLEKSAIGRDAAIRQVAWGMLSSIEFCVNH
jgi:hypothetical protein